MLDYKLKLICTSHYDASQKRAIHVHPESDGGVVVSIDDATKPNLAHGIKLDSKARESLWMSLKGDDMDTKYKIVHLENQLLGFRHLLKQEGLEHLFAKLDGFGGVRP